MFSKLMKGSSDRDSVPDPARELTALPIPLLWVAAHATLPTNLTASVLWISLFSTTDLEPTFRGSIEVIGGVPLTRTSIYALYTKHIQKLSRIFEGTVNDILF
jgi:hypothetical protein